MMHTRGQVLWVGLIAFLGVVGGYVALTLAGHDATGLVQAAVLLIGAIGVGAHNEVRSRQLSNNVDHVAENVDTVKRTTEDGELDKRMRDAAGAAVRTTFRELGYNVPADPRNRPVMPPRGEST